MFRRIVVLLDSSSPAGGAFAHALLWAHRLRAPLRGVSVLADDDLLVSGPPEERERACAAVCAEHGIVWELAHCSNLDGGAHKLAGPSDLLVLGQSVSPACMRALSIDPAARAATLICPNATVKVERVLLVDGPGETNAQFLTAGAGACRSLRAGMVILSLARSQRGANRRRQQAQEALAGSGMGIDFDVMIGSESGGALANIARWRHCQMVITRRPRPSFWRRWLHYGPTDDLLELSEKFLVLILPAEQAPRSMPNREQTAKSASKDPQEVAPRCG